TVVALKRTVRVLNCIVAVLRHAVAAPIPSLRLAHAAKRCRHGETWNRQRKSHHPQRENLCLRYGNRHLHSLSLDLQRENLDPQRENVDLQSENLDLATGKCPPA